MGSPIEQPSLTVVSGSMQGTVFVVDESIDNVLIGSDASCRFALPGTGVDPIHARLWIHLEGITVYDTNCARGVYINDDRVQGEARVRNGDILWLGPPGDAASVMLQCRLPGNDTTREPTLLLAPDAIQPEPPVMLAPEDAFLEPEVTILPDDLDLSSLVAEPPRTTGWDPIAGGITSASDPPWVAGAPTIAPDSDPSAPIAVVPRHELEPPPIPRRAPKPPPPTPRPRLDPSAFGPMPARRGGRRPVPDHERMALQSRQGASRRLLIFGMVVVAGLAVAAGAWRLTRGPTTPQQGNVAPPPTVPAPPATRPLATADPEAPVVAPDAPLEEEVTIVPGAEPLKTFISGPTVVQSRGAKSDVGGLHTRIEFAVNPPQVKPGDDYTVQIFLVNGGKKTINVAGVSVTTDLNGSKSTRSVPSQVWEVAPSQRALLGELPGVWPEAVDSWSTEVMVTANKGDSIQSRLTWDN